MSSSRTRKWNPLASVGEVAASAPSVGALPLLLLVGLISVERFDAAAFGVLAPEIRRSFQLDNGQFLAIAGTTTVIPLLTTVYIGYLADKHNRVRLSQFGGLIWGVTAIFTGLAPVVGLLVVMRLAGGIGQAVGQPVYPSLLADYYPPDKLPTVYSTFQLGTNAIGLIAGPVAGGLSYVFGWRTAFVVLGAPTFLIVAWLSRLTEPERGVSAGLSAFALGDPVGFRDAFRRLRSIPTLRRTWSAAVFFGGGVIAFTSLQSLFFEDVYHVGPAGRGALTAVFGAAGLLGTSVGGRLAQRQVTEGRLDGLGKMLGAGIATFGVGMLLMAAAPALWLSVLALGVVSVGAAAFLPSYTTMSALISPPRLRSQAFAWTTMFVAIGALTMSPTIGAVADRWGDRLGLIVLGGLVVVCSLVAATTRHLVASDVAAAGLDTSVVGATAPDATETVVVPLRSE